MASLTPETMEKARMIYLRAKCALTPLGRTGIKLLWGYDTCSNCPPEQRGPFKEPHPERLGTRHPDEIKAEVSRLWPTVRRSTDQWQ